MTEILKALANVKLKNSFLIKSYFMQYPIKMLLGTYGCNIFLISYVVHWEQRHQKNKKMRDYFEKFCQLTGC